MARPTVDETPVVSVVIITRDQRRFLERSLHAIADQTAVSGPIETIVVDSGSTDGAQAFVLANGAHLIDYGPQRFRYARAYNLGFAVARAPIVVRLSGDAIPADPYWLRALLAPFSDLSVAAVWGRQILPSHIRNPVESRFDRWLRPGQERRYTRAITVLGSSMAVRRDLWQRYPFDELLPQAEDYDWLHHATRQGFAGIYTPDAAILHGHDESLGRALRRSFAQSILQGVILVRR